MSIASLNRKGQVTVPNEVLDAFALEAGDQLVFDLRPDGVVEIRRAGVDLMSLCGVLKPKRRGVSIADMEMGRSPRSLPAPSPAR